MAEAEEVVLRPAIPQPTFRLPKWRTQPHPNLRVVRGQWLFNGCLEEGPANDSLPSPPSPSKSLTDQTLARKHDPSSKGPCPRCGSATNQLPKIADPLRARLVKESQRQRPIKESRSQPNLPKLSKRPDVAMPRQKRGHKPRSSRSTPALPRPPPSHNLRAHPYADERPPLERLERVLGIRECVSKKAAVSNNRRFEQRVEAWNGFGEQHADNSWPDQLHQFAPHVPTARKPSVPSSTIDSPVTTEDCLLRQAVTNVHASAAVDVPTSIPVVSPIKFAAPEPVVHPSAIIAPVIIESSVHDRALLDAPPRSTTPPPEAAALVHPPASAASDKDAFGPGDFLEDMEILEEDCAKTEQFEALAPASDVPEEHEVNDQSAVHTRGEAPTDEVEGRLGGTEVSPEEPKQEIALVEQRPGNAEQCADAPKQNLEQESNESYGDDMERMVSNETYGTSSFASYEDSFDDESAADEEEEEVSQEDSNNEAMPEDSIGKHSDADPVLESAAASNASSSLSRRTAPKPLEPLEAYVDTSMEHKDAARDTQVKDDSPFMAQVARKDVDGITPATGTTRATPTADDDEDDEEACTSAIVAPHSVASSPGASQPLIIEAVTSAASSLFASDHADLAAGNLGSIQTSPMGSPREDCMPREISGNLGSIQTSPMGSPREDRMPREISGDVSGPPSTAPEDQALQHVDSTEVSSEDQICDSLDGAADEEVSRQPSTAKDEMNSAASFGDEDDLPLEGLESISC